MKPTLNLDYEQVRKLVDGAVPFNRHVGVLLTGVGDGWATAELDLNDEVKNHLGTMHGAALYQVAEFAAAIAFVGAFAPFMGQVFFAARKAEIDYPKAARGRVVANGRLESELPEIIAEIERRGHARARAVSSVCDVDGTVVATLRVVLGVRRVDSGSSAERAGIEEVR
ncbi:PaaI family thioesterase [Amycolatopsis sp. NPDC059090]|uniref:PaaI family thioesterase n=1 Tax=unclassified Amycolatopsis TaxID=2618356 RepID=UPI00366ABAC4